MIYATTSVDIAREREELKKWFDDEWAAITRREELARAMRAKIEDKENLVKRYGERRANYVLAKRIESSRRKAFDVVIDAANPDDVREIEATIKQIRDECPALTSPPPILVKAYQIVKALREYDERSTALDRIYRLSDERRFAVDAPSLPQGLH
jgi:hypothetical protein